MDAVLQALADQHRRTVLDILRDHPATAGELADALPIARPGVSRHLRVLREVGLVEVRADAQRRIYALRVDGLVEIDTLMEQYRKHWTDHLDALERHLAYPTCRIAIRTWRPRSTGDISLRVCRFVLASIFAARWMVADMWG
jgi:DNA-binding transcriptional ArsR family regulator